VERLVRRVVATHLPGHSIDSVVLLGEGVDNVTYEVNGELVVRFSKEPDPERRAAAVLAEAYLLWAVADISPLPVPVPLFVVAEEGCLAYFTLPGVPLLEVSAPVDRESIARRLGEFLAALHAAPAERMAELVEADDPPLEDWRREAAEEYAIVRPNVPAAHRRPIEEFLAVPPPIDGHAPAFTHNDLGIEHVLVDPATGAITGVVDWSDAAIADPAYDFGLLLRDLGPAALDAAVGGYGSEPAGLRERAAFYARCTVLEDLAYGLETGRKAYVDKSLAGLEWLFRPSHPPGVRCP
jgi:aminoglycoside phosphotransferase (APT) family kinase protein